MYSVNAKTRKIKQKLSGDAYVLLNTDKFDMLLDELTAHVHPGQRSLSATSPAVQSPNRRRPRPPSPDPYDIDTVMDIEYDRQAEAAYAEHQAQERKRRREHLHESVAAAQQSVQQPAQIQQHPDAQAEPALPQHGQKSAPLAAASHTSLGQHQSSAQPAGSDSSAGKSCLKELLKPNTKSNLAGIVRAPWARHTNTCRHNGNIGLPCWRQGSCSIYHALTFKSTCIQKCMCGVQGSQEVRRKKPELVN